MGFLAFIFGIIPIGLFLLIRLSVFKSWFILKTLPGLLSARMFFAALPIGIGLLGIMILPAFPGYSPDKFSFTLLSGIFVIGGPLIGFWFMYHPPKWVKPSWLQWLEQEYGYCLSILIEEAQKMNRWAWEAQVRTQSGMQAWIDDVFTHRREDVDFAWKVEKFRLIERQVVKPEGYGIKSGMKIEGYAPVHRQHDIVLTQEEMDIVIPFRNAKYRIDDKYKSN